MKKKQSLFIFKVFKSYYCQIVFIISGLLGFYFIPKKIFLDKYATALMILFILTFSLTITCLVRTIKERYVSAIKNKHSLIGLIATILGFVSMQACGIGAPICGASLGGGFLGIFFPGVFFSFFNRYGVYIIVISIIIQLISLYSLNCFKKTS